MSRLDAAGWALSRFHSVSVVPMIQCRPQGITNSTDVGVRRMIPVVERIRSRGTTRWMPFDARTLNWPRSPTMACVSSVQTPVALITCWAWTSNSSSVFQVPYPDADDPFPLAEEADDPGAARDGRPVGGGGPHDVHRVTGVVELGVEVLDGAHEGVLAQAGHRTQGLAPGQVTVERQAGAVAGGTRHEVVQGDAGGDVAALPAPVLQRVEERDRPCQVGREPGEDEAPLPQGLEHQGDVEHLEISQPAVDELARAGTRTAGPVAALDEGDREAPGGGVECRARADHAPADDDDVERAPRHVGQRRLAFRGSEAAGPAVETVRHGSSVRPRFSATPPILGPSPARRSDRATRHLCSRIVVIPTG